MRNRRKLIVLLVSVLTAVGALLWFTSEKEPSYEGRLLSEWITIHGLDYASNPYSSTSQYRKREASDAIRHIGTNALPWLLAWSDYESIDWGRKFRAASQKLPQSVAQSRPVIWLLSSTDSFTRADEATTAFIALGPIAAPAVPELIRRIHLTKTAKEWRAMVALSSIGTAALPAMTDLVSKYDEENSYLVMACIIRMGTNARPLVPLLVPHLQSTNWTVAMHAATALGELKSDPELVVPALIKGLDNPVNLVQFSMLFAMRQFGELTRPVLPALTNALSNPDVDVRNYASNAIWRITTSAPTNAPPR